MVGSLTTPARETVLANYRWPSAAYASESLLVCPGHTADRSIRDSRIVVSVTNAFTALAATLTTPRASHTATLLPSGAVLLTGGGTGVNGTLLALSSVELYGP
jgi:hypothetical protein